MIEARPPLSSPGAGALLPPLAALLAAGFAFRWLQVPIHTNFWAVDWLSYYEPQARDLREFRPLHFLFRWQGLHPPASGWIHGLGLAVGLPLSAHWALCCAAGLAAATILGSTAAGLAGWPALVFAVAWIAGSSFQANYGPNTTPYPWSMLAVAASTDLLWRALRSPSPNTYRRAGIAAAVAVQVHILAAAAVCAQALVVLAYRRRSGASPHPYTRSWLVPVGLSLAVVVGVALTATRDPWTFHIGEVQGGWIHQSLQILESRFPAGGATQSLLAVLGVGVVLPLLDRQPQSASRFLALLLLLQAGASLAALALFMELHVADPRITHYLLIPHFLLVATAALGWGRALAHMRPRHREALLFALALTTGLAAGTGLQWSLERNKQLEDERSGSSVQEVHRAFAEAGPGDVVAYLWDHQFLNDEPEHWDPIAAHWPLGRLGRACFHLELPPKLCNQHNGSTFFFAPDAFTGPLAPIEESLRRFVNEAGAPGQADLFLLPGPEAPPRPWPLESWCQERGAEVKSLGSDGLVRIRFPAGTHIEPPPPLHPGPQPKSR